MFIHCAFRIRFLCDATFTRRVKAHRVTDAVLSQTNDATVTDATYVMTVCIARLTPCILTVLKLTTSIRLFPGMSRSRLSLQWKAIGRVGRSSSSSRFGRCNSVPSVMLSRQLGHCQHRTLVKTFRNNKY